MVCTKVLETLDFGVLNITNLDLRCWGEDRTHFSVDLFWFEINGNWTKSLFGIDVDTYTTGYRAVTINFMGLKYEHTNV